MQIPKRLDAEIASRASHSRDFGPTTRQCLERYFALLQRTVHALQPRFSVAEQSLMLDALNGSLMTAELPQTVAMSIKDAVAMDGLDAKWQVDRAQLFAKLTDLTDLECVAVADAAERWWNLVAKGENPALEEMFR